MIQEIDVKTWKLISEHDGNQLRDLNRKMPPLVNSLIHSQIETQCKSHPLNEAVCVRDGTLTYKERKPACK